MEKKTYIQPSQKEGKIRVQSMLVGSGATGGNDGNGTPSFGTGPADPDGGMMARKRLPVNI